MAKTTVELPEGLHRKLRVKAALDNCSMNDILVSALNKYLESFRIGPEMLDVETVPRNGKAEHSTSKEGQRRA